VRTSPATGQDNSHMLSICIKRKGNRLSAGNINLKKSDSRYLPENRGKWDKLYVEDSKRGCRHREKIDRYDAFRVITQE